MNISQIVHTSLRLQAIQLIDPQQGDLGSLLADLDLLGYTTGSNEEEQLAECCLAVAEALGSFQNKKDAPQIEELRRLAAEYKKKTNPGQTEG